MKGTEGPDRFALGGTASEVTLSTDPLSTAPPPVTWDGLGSNVAVIEAGGGNDRVDASAIQRPHTFTILEGGAGNDVLIGSRFEDGLKGGPGHDVLLGGAGNDELDGRDGKAHDRLDCGAGGEDRVEPGRGDSVTSCERTVRPHHPHLHP